MSYTNRLLQELPEDSHMSGDITLCGTTISDDYIVEECAAGN